MTIFGFAVGVGAKSFVVKSMSHDGGAAVCSAGAVSGVGGGVDCLVSLGVIGVVQCKLFQAGGKVEPIHPGMTGARNKEPSDRLPLVVPSNRATVGDPAVLTVRIGP